MPHAAHIHCQTQPQNTTTTHNHNNGTSVSHSSARAHTTVSTDGSSGVGKRWKSVKRVQKGPEQGPESRGHGGEGEVGEGCGSAVHASPTTHCTAHSHDSVHCLQCKHMSAPPYNAHTQSKGDTQQKHTLHTAHSPGPHCGRLLRLVWWMHSESAGHSCRPVPRATCGGGGEAPGRLRRPEWPRTGRGSRGTTRPTRACAGDGRREAGVRTGGCCGEEECHCQHSHGLHCCGVRGETTQGTTASATPLYQY